MQSHLRTFQISLIYILKPKSSGALEVLIVTFKIVSQNFFSSAIRALSIGFGQVWNIVGLS